MSDRPVLPREEEIELLIEWPVQHGLVEASLGGNLEEMKKESQKAMNVAMGVISSMAYRVTRVIQEMQDNTRPDEMEVEFSLKLDLEGGVIIPMVAKTTVGGQFNIRFKWNLEKPQRATVLINEKP
jgi:hypothetical protein